MPPPPPRTSIRRTKEKKLEKEEIEVEKERNPLIPNLIPMQSCMNPSVTKEINTKTKKKAQNSLKIVCSGKKYQSILNNHRDQKINQLVTYKNSQSETPSQKKKRVVAFTGFVPSGGIYDFETW